jgi:hypothetical protein
MFKLDESKHVTKPAIAPRASTATVTPLKERRLVKAGEHKDGEWKDF